MKRNNLMKASGVLLALTLATSCFVGGTFAKYVSEGQGEDKARVAKWGVDVEWQSDLFARVYTSNNGTTVQGSIPDMVVAPGTSAQENQGLRLTVTGKPEVMVKIDTVVESLEFENWMVTENGEEATDANPANQFYCPLVFSINGVKMGDNSTSGDNNLDYSSAESLRNTLKQKIEQYASAQYDEIATLDKTFSLTWEWPFDTDTDSAFKWQSDKKDTYLGNLAAQGEAVPTISITVNTMVTQID